MHGKTSLVYHDGRTIYKGLPNPFTATRYHSLILKRETLPACLEISAETERGEIMGVRHREFIIEGVQFHPESILTEGGKTLLRNFLNIVRGREPAVRSKFSESLRKERIVVSRGVANLDY
jgi:anthranilate synthase/aminodeoxychorismate synthase-like glutamine amidotransferase